MSIGGQKIFIPKPPAKGAFPLDHDGECRDEMVKYMECLKQHKLDSSACRSLSQSYLKCRMDSKLMAQEDWKKLGFSDEPSGDPSQPKK